MRIFLLLTVVLFFTSGCKLILGTVLLGIDFTADIQQQEDIEKREKRHGIADKRNYYLSSFDYFPSLKAQKSKQLSQLERANFSEIETERHKRIINQRFHDLNQPIQIHIFDRSGRPLFKMLNCHLDPAIPMRWNRYGSFDEFVPQPLEVRGFQIDLVDSLQFFVPFFRKSNGQHVVVEDLPSADYYVLVMWNDFFKRASRKLLRKLRKTYMKLDRDDIVFLFVNNHNAQVWNDFNVKRQQNQVKKGKAPSF